MASKKYLTNNHPSLARRRVGVTKKTNGHFDRLNVPLF